MSSNPQETADLVTLTEETFIEKIHFLCSDIWKVLKLIFCVTAQKMKFSI